MKKLIVLVTLLLAIPFNSWATAQFPEILIYEGEKIFTYSEPLEQYFNKDRPKPMKWMQATCSAIWRGYLGTWEIKNDKLYLIKIVEGGCGNDSPEIPLSKFFPGKKSPIFAEWYTGTLVVPEGKVLNYVHMGYQTTYEKELHIKIIKGKVVGKKTIDNRKRKK